MKNAYTARGRTVALCVSLLLFAMLFGQIANLRADGSDEFAITIHPCPNKGLSEAAERTVAMHVFGGAALKFQTMVEAPLGTRLSPHIDLVQTASSIDATVLKDVPVSSELAFDKRTSLTSDCELPALPVVERITRMRLLLQAVGTDRPVQPPTPLEMYVYPVEKPDAWKTMIAARLAASGSDRLEIFGQGKALRTFLKDRRVDFEDGGEEWPEELKARTFYVAETPLPVPARFASTAGVRLTLIPPPGISLLLPGIYRDSDPQQGNTLKVMLPELLKHLSDDPRRQQTLAEIFRLALEPHLPADLPDLNLSHSP